MPQHLVDGFSVCDASKIARCVHKKNSLPLPPKRIRVERIAKSPLAAPLHGRLPVNAMSFTISGTMPGRLYRSDNAGQVSDLCAISWQTSARPGNSWSYLITRKNHNRRHYQECPSIIGAPRHVLQFTTRIACRSSGGTRVGSEYLSPSMSLGSPVLGRCRQPGMIHLLWKEPSNVASTQEHCQWD